MIVEEEEKEVVTTADPPLQVLPSSASSASEMPANTTLGLPPNIRACPFDLDGVSAETATVHARARQRVFDDYPRARAQMSGLRATRVVHDLLELMEAP